MRDVAFISDVASLPRFMRVRELFAMVADIHPNFDTKRAISFLDGTDVKVGALIGNLSKGMLAQLHLAVVMAIEAKLLVLDEPTLGLDITYRKRFYRRLAEDYMNAGRTILITTHQVDEIEFLFTDIMFIRDGALLLHMPMPDVSKHYVQLIVTPDKADAARALKPVFAESRFGQIVMVYHDADRAPLEALGTVSTPTLSDLFVALMSRETGVN
jgi:ABC-2 type transport system ATP-binding protein